MRSYSLISGGCKSPAAPPVSAHGWSSGYYQPYHPTFAKKRGIFVNLANLIILTCSFVINTPYYHNDPIYKYTWFLTISTYMGKCYKVPIVWKLLKAQIQELTSIQNKFEPFINGIDIKFDQPVPMAFNSLYCETSPNSCGSSGLFGWLGIPELCFLMSLPNPLLLYHHRRFLFVYV